MAVTKQIKYKDSSGNEQLVDIGVDAKNVETNTFTQAATRENIKSGEKLPTVFGKLMKWFADLKTVAWTGSYNDLANKPSMGNIGGTVAVNQGGTGATTASQARVNLGVGSAGTQGVANNCTTTAAGYALDARQGKTLMDKANQISNDLATVGQRLKLLGTLYKDPIVFTESVINHRFLYYEVYNSVKYRVGFGMIPSITIDSSAGQYFFPCQIGYQSQIWHSIGPVIFLFRTGAQFESSNDSTWSYGFIKFYAID